MICSGGEERGPAESKTHGDGKTAIHRGEANRDGFARNGKEREPQRDGGEARNQEREKRNENQARLRKLAKTQHPIQRGPRHRRQREKEEKSEHSGGPREKQSTPDVVEVSINIC